MMVENPFSSLRRMSTAASVFAAFALLFGIFAVIKAFAGNHIHALQHEIFSLLFLQLYQFEITKSMIRRVSRK